MVDEAKVLIDTIHGKGTDIQDAFRAYQDTHFIQRSPEFFWKGKDISLEDVESEIADVYIALHNYANARGISLEKVVREKLAKIEQKRSKHQQDGTIY
jgi:NTP pyrophosphatase (non-canonical NTP hydrolase)